MAWVLSTESHMFSMLRQTYQEHNGDILVQCTQRCLYPKQNKQVGSGIGEDLMGQQYPKNHPLFPWSTMYGTIQREIRDVSENHSRGSRTQRHKKSSKIPLGKPAYTQACPLWNQSRGEGSFLLETEDFVMVTTTR